MSDDPLADAVNEWLDARTASRKAGAEQVNRMNSICLETIEPSLFRLRDSFQPSGLPVTITPTLYVDPLRQLVKGTVINGFDVAIATTSGLKITGDPQRQLFTAAWTALDVEDGGAIIGFDQMSDAMMLEILLDFLSATRAPLPEVA